MITESRDTEPLEGEPLEGGQRLYLGDLLQVVRRRLWLLVVVMMVVMGTAVGVTYAQTPIYQASAKLLVGQKEDVATQQNLEGEVSGLERLTRTLVEAVSSRPIAEAVIQQLGLQMTPEDFLENLSAQQVGETQFIQLDYSDPDPQMAQQIANTTADVLSEQVSEVSPEASGVTATVWEWAPAPKYPERPNPLLNILLALVLGAILGVGLALLLEYSGDNWRSPEEVEQVTGMPVFGVIPSKFHVLKNTAPEGKERETLLITVSDPASVAADAYRTLRTNLLYARVGDHPKIIVLTSAGLGEGTGVTCANLGVVLAQADNNVLLVDCDFRSPILHKIFGLPNTRGITDVLMEQYSLQKVWQEVLPGLKVVTVGPVPPDPAELLSSSRFTGFLNRVSREFDYVLLDAPPMELVADPLVLTRQSEGVLFILDAQRTSKRKAWRGVRRLETVDANILGAVVNAVDTSWDG